MRKVGAVAVVAVMDQETRRLAIPATRFDDLTSSPLSGWVTSDVHMNHLAACMTNDKEDIDGSEQQSPHAEEVTGPDLARVRRQEGSPSR